MLDYFKENKNYIFFIFLIVLIIVFSFIYFSSEENIQIKQKNDIKYEQKEVNNQINNSFVEKKVENTKLEVLEEKKDEKLDKFIILNSTISEKSKYSLKLTINKEINSDKSTISYIIVTGTIVDKDSSTDIFSLSLNDNYIYDLNNTTLEVLNNKTKEINSCEGTFLNTILPEFSYHIQVDIKDNFTDCYIKSQSEGKNAKRLNNRLINDLDFYKNIQIEEKTLTEATEFKNLKNDDN